MDDQGGLLSCATVRTVVVLSGGPPPQAALELPPGAKVVTANGGAELARQLDLQVDLAVGDFDSVSKDRLSHVLAFERHPEAKDATDLELAMQAALRLGAERVLLIGSDGGRLDHLFGGLQLLASPSFTGVQVDAQLGPSLVHVIRHDRTIAGRQGELVSLFAMHGDALGVSTQGLRYPLEAETLQPGSSRGVSNVFEAPLARVTLVEGVLLAVRPDPHRGGD